MRRPGQEAANAPAPSADATESEQPDVPTGATSTPFASSTEPVAVEPGTYQIPKSAWSVADFTVTFPKGWTVQYGHVYAKLSNAGDELGGDTGFYAVVPDAIYADACVGSNSGQLIWSLPRVDDLLKHCSAVRPEEERSSRTTSGRLSREADQPHRPERLRPKRLQREGHRPSDLARPPADKYFVLLQSEIASVYILDVNGQRQVFLTGHSSAASQEQCGNCRPFPHFYHIEP